MQRAMKRASPAVARVAFGVGMMAAIPVPAPAAAQGETCELVSVGGYTYRTRFDSVSFVHHASGGIDYRCADGMRLLADSAVVFEASDQVHLFGRVHLVDVDTELDADTAQYFGRLRQLNAWSNVTVRDLGSGAVISGQRLLYDRASEVRALDRMQVYDGRPHATVYPVARAEPPPAEESVPVEESVAADDSATVHDSTIVEDSAAMQDSAVVQDSATVEDAGTATETVAGPDSAAAEASGQPADSAVTEDALPADAEEDAGSVAEVVPVEDTVRLPPYEIDADRFILEGRRYFRAGGNVVVVRDSLIAFGDSLDYDQEAGSMSIIGGARVEGQDYLLASRTISVMPSSGLREELLARHLARLSGQQVDMNAPAIRMFLDNGLVNRLVAIGEIPPLPGEPQPVDTEGLSPGDAARLLALTAARETDSAAVADSIFTPAVAADQFNLTGDSIDVLSPGQVLQLVTAVGSARAEGAADDSVSARGLPEVARRDWMEGDTIYARFASPGSTHGTAAADSAHATADSVDTAGESAEPATNPADPGPVSSPPPGGQGSRLETMTAVGSARSLYRLVDSDTLQTIPDSAGTDTGGGAALADTVTSQSGSAQADAQAAPALHWVEGQKIIVYLEGRQVIRMNVEGQTTGFHLEPLPPGGEPDSAAVADSATVAADSATARLDSLMARPDPVMERPDTTMARPDTTVHRSRNR